MVASPCFGGKQLTAILSTILQIILVQELKRVLSALGYSQGSMAILKVEEEGSHGTLSGVLRGISIFHGVFLVILTIFCMPKRKKVVQQGQIGLSVVLDKLFK